MPLRYTFDRDNMYLYPWYISDLTITEDLKRIFNYSVKECFVINENGFISVYLDDASTLKLGAKIFARVSSDEKFFHKILKSIYSLSNDLMLFCRHLPNAARLKRLSDKELVKIYLNYITKLRNLRAWGWFPVFIDGLEKSFLSEHILEQLRSFLDKKGVAHLAGQYYSTLSSSEEQSEVQQEELARVKLLLKIGKMANSADILKALQNNSYGQIKASFPLVAGMLERHARQYGWLTYAYCGPVMNVEYLLSVLKDNLKKGDIARQKKDIELHYRTIAKEKKFLLGELVLPHKLEYLLRVSAELMFIKDFRKGIYQKSYVAMDAVLEEIARRLGWTLKEVKYLVYDEVGEALLKNKADEFHDKVAQRVKKCCYLVSKGRIQVWEGEKGKKVIAKILKNVQKETSSEENKNVTELKGLIAYSGRVQGTVKIVLRASDVAKVKEGDILVSSATNPDLIVAMKKAAAFVTDTGGIISHAAIISRELKKPCVVGTKIGTHVFKDGDVVEVDADRGVVKILERK